MSNLPTPRQTRRREFTHLLAQKPPQGLIGVAPFKVGTRCRSRGVSRIIRYDKLPPPLPLPPPPTSTLIFLNQIAAISRSPERDSCRRERRGSERKEEDGAVHRNFHKVRDSASAELRLFPDGGRCCYAFRVNQSVTTANMCYGRCSHIERANALPCRAMPSAPPQVKVKM